MKLFERLRNAFRRDVAMISQQELAGLRADVYHAAFDGRYGHVPDMRGDGFQSSTLGFGTPADKANQFMFRADNRVPRHTLDALYWSSGLIRTVVDLPINDMTRRGIEIQHEDAKALQQMMNDLNVLPLCNRAGKYGRIFQLGAVVLDIEDGRELWEPVDLKKIKSINFGFVLDSAWIQPYDFNFWSEPVLYAVTTDNLQYIHKDRLLLFNGFDAGLNNRLENGGLYESIVDAIFQPFRNLSVDYGAASTMIKDFSVPVIKMAGLAEKAATSTNEAVASAKNRIALLRRLLSIVNAIVIGDKDSYENTTRSVAGYAELVKLAKEFFCMVSGIPHSKLFKEGPGGGLNSGKGESEDNDWDDIILDLQNSMLRPQLNKVLKYFGALQGIFEPIDFIFKPLHQPTEKELAEISKTKAETAKTKAEADNIYFAMVDGESRAISLEEIRQNRFIEAYGDDRDVFWVSGDKPPLAKVPLRQDGGDIKDLVLKRLREHNGYAA